MADTIRPGLRMRMLRDINTRYVFLCVCVCECVYVLLLVALSTLKCTRNDIATGLLARFFFFLLVSNHRKYYPICSVLDSRKGTTISKTHSIFLRTRC